MISVAHWHPIVVHLPLGLWCTVAPLYTLAMRARTAERSALLATVATVNLLLGSCAAALALLTGLLAATGLSVVGIAQETLTRHVGWALLTTLLLAAITLLRAVGKPLAARPGLALVICCWLALVSLTATGYYGGRNVYGYGLGVDLSLANERAQHRPPPTNEPPPKLP